MNARDAAIEDFSARYGGDPETVLRAPGRVNLIGEHTDYNDGFVLPMAIDQAIWVALRKRDDRLVRLSSVGNGQVDFDLDALVPDTDDWAEYVKGVAWAMGGSDLVGWEGSIASDIPIGAGLSSSAAIEIAATLAFATVSDQHWDPVTAARTSQRAENEWMGMPCGIMDQLIIAAAAEGRASLIDCRTLDMTPVRLPDDVAVVILDTATRRQLVESEYEDRRKSCELAAGTAGVPALRDLSIDDVAQLSSIVDETTFRRTRHVVSENARTIEAAAALDRGDTARFGTLMAESHRSLRDDFEVSSEALDLIVDIASGLEGCLGARMTGAGFGGCAVALVAESTVPAFVDEVIASYEDTTGLTPSAYVSMPVAGAGISRQ
ncbi:MAG: galactokinase [Actinomycetota bacterium]